MATYQNPLRRVLNIQRPEAPSTITGHPKMAQARWHEGPGCQVTLSRDSTLTQCRGVWWRKGYRRQQNASQALFPWKGLTPSGARARKHLLFRVRMHAGPHRAWRCMPWMLLFSALPKSEEPFWLWNIRFLHPVNYTAWHFPASCAPWIHEFQAYLQ